MMKPIGIDGGKKFEIGMTEDSRRTINHATPQHLERLASTKDPVHGWRVDVGERFFSACELVTDILNGDLQRGAFVDFMRIKVDKLGDDTDFAEGCLIGWKDKNPNAL